MEMERGAFKLKEQAFELSVGWAKTDSHSIRINP